LTSSHLVFAAIFIACFPALARGQEPPRERDGARPALPAIRAGTLGADFHLDGVLSEPDWDSAEAIDGLTMFDPVEGGELTGRTRVRVLASASALVIGIEAFDPTPDGIVSYSISRDPQLRNEDHIRIVLDPFLDGRSGYVFAVNPRGARYDALVARRGEGDDASWDAIWDAKTSRSAEGWSAEIRIPLQSIVFNGGLREWGFNVERRRQRGQEMSRWASPIRDARITQTSRAGRLTGLPDFSTGIGLTVRPSSVGGFAKPSVDAHRDGSFDSSLDITQRLGSNVNLIGTVNTDFAETEVDARQTNLTRFSLFFPEKRTFFLENADIFDFGIGLQSGGRPAIVPFFTRRVGLLAGREVPVRGGGKLSGRIGNTNFGGLITRTGSVDGFTDATTMGAVRIQQNVLEESTAGVIATVGDPAGRAGSYLLGTDFTFQTTHFAGDKNLLAGAWGLITGREGLTGDRTAFGASVDYPNDIWDLSATFQRIGDGFDPSMGFVPRRGIYRMRGGVARDIRPSLPWLRVITAELFPSLVLDLDGKWESYRVFTAPLNWDFEGAQRLEFNVVAEGERLSEPFDIAEGVEILPGSYHWVRYRIEGGLSPGGKVNPRGTLWFGPFYDGSLKQLELGLDINPAPIATFELSLERNTGRLSAGSFTQELYQGRVRLNLSPDLEVGSFIQYDNETREVGTNSRLRWTVNSLGDLFIIYNHTIGDVADRWQLISNQLLIKFQYAFRY